MIRGTLAALAVALMAFATPAAGAEKQTYPISYHAFPLSSGTTSGTQVDRSGGLVLAKSGLTTTTYADPFGYPARDYLAGTWTSPRQPAGFGFMELVSSWKPTLLRAPGSRWRRAPRRWPTDTARSGT